jgi:hypothetical protein
MVGSSEPFHVSDFDYLLGLVIVTSTVLPTVSCRCVERVFRCSVFKQVKPLSKHSNVSDKMCACAWCWSIPFISLRTALLTAYCLTRSLPTVVAHVLFARTCSGLSLS